jgi:hypothetical protein
LRDSETEQEFEQNMAGMLHEMEQELGADFETSQFPRQGRKKRSGKLREEAERVRLEKQAEELRSKTIASIYRRLARVLHPDLEQDPVRRQSKLTLMQDLTAAYRANDLHTLLRLELEWIHREESDLDRLTDERVGVYNHILKEQVDDLEMEIEQLPFHPRYGGVMQGSPFFDFRTDGPELALELDQQIASMRVSIDLFESENAWEGVQELLLTVRGRR